MDINSVIEDGKKSSKYIVLEDGDEITGKFVGEFNRVVKDFKGTTSIKYEIEFKANEYDEPKIFSGSANFFKDCNARAKAKGLEFNEARFRITRLGVGAETKYLPVVVE